MKGRRKVLDRRNLRAMLLDPQFYLACPAFADLQETAREQIAASDLAKKRQRLCCGREYIQLRPLLQGFTARLIAAKVDWPERLAAVKRYLGSDITRLTIYYKPVKGGPSRTEL